MFLETWLRGGLSRAWQLKAKALGGLGGGLRMGDLPDGPWNVAKGDFNGRPMFIRISAGAVKLKKDHRLRYRVGVAVPLTAPNSEGLPADPESAILDSIEDAHCKSL